MKKIFILLAAVLLSMPLVTMAQRDKKGPSLSLTKQQIGDSVVAIYNYYSKFRDDLSERLTQADDTTLINALLLQYDLVERNCNQHIFDFCEYYVSTSPDALEFIFSLRNMVPKDHIKTIYASLKGKNKKLPYAELLNAYLQSPQVEVGKNAINFSATTFDNQPFDLAQLTADKNVVIIFGGLDKISTRDLTWLNMVYDGMDQNKTEIIYFDPAATTAEQLATLRTEKNLQWNFIGDFMGEWSPATMAYDVQATPTIVCIKAGGMVTDWGVGDLQMVINALTK